MAGLPGASVAVVPVLEAFFLVLLSDLTQLVALLFS